MSIIFVLTSKVTDTFSQILFCSADRNKRANMTDKSFCSHFVSPSYVRGACVRARKWLRDNPHFVFCRDPIVLIEECKHPTVMKDMCAECGADLRRFVCQIRS